jgi:hypothetical protein
VGRGSNSIESGCDGRSSSQMSYELASLGVEGSAPSNKAGSDDMNGDTCITVSSGFVEASSWDLSRKRWQKQFS